MILDKLLEKKDIDIYLWLRIKRLEQTLRQDIKTYPENRREIIAERLSSKISELGKLRFILKNNILKDRSKLMWQHFYGEEENKKKIYVIDLDGTIATQEKDYSKAKPFKDIIEKINKLYEEGHTIIIFTARGTKIKIDYSILTKKQLKLWGVKYHELIMGKPAGDYYIDDKNLSIKEFIKD